MGADGRVLYLILSRMHPHSFFVFSTSYGAAAPGLYIFYFSLGIAIHY
jgi:hypothetical protein